MSRSAAVVAAGSGSVEVGKQGRALNRRASDRGPIDALFSRAVLMVGICRRAAFETHPLANQRLPPPQLGS